MSFPAEVMAAAAEEAALAPEDNQLVLAGAKHNQEDAAIGDHPVPPYGPDDMPADGLTCYYNGCNFKAFTYGKILDHVKNHHKQKFSGLTGTYLHTMGLQDKMTQQVAYRAAKKKQEEGEVESEPKAKKAKGQQAPGSGQEEGQPKQKKAKKEGDVVKVPGVGSKDLMPMHKVEDQQEEESDTKWVAMRCWIKCDVQGKPVTPLVCAGPCSSTLEPGKKVKGPGVQSSFASWLKPGMHPDLLPPPGVPSLSPELADIKAQLAAAVGPKKIEVKLPKVGISTFLSDWNQPEKEAKRNSCPISCTSTMDFSSFAKYLKDAGQKQVSIDTYIMNIKRFFNLLAIEKGAFEPTGVLCSVYQEDIMQKLMDAPLMGFQFSWTRKIIWALDHFCSHLKVYCNKKRYLEARTTIQQLEDEVLSAYKKQCLKARKGADRKKFHVDAARLDHFPSSDEAKEAVLKAMVSLASLSHEATGKPQLSFNEKLNATTAMVGIIHYNSFAGRSGEWQSMPRNHVEEQIALGKDYLLCPEHKTSDTYGTLAKYVPAGSMKSMAVYMGLPGKIKDLLLEPANSQSLQVSIAQHLQRFGKLFLGKDDPPNSNLIRKQYHTLLLRMSREGQAMDLMRKVDAHSAEVAQKVYATTTPSDDSKLGKALFQQLFGEPVEWPSQEMITATKVPDLSQQCQLVLFTGDCGEQEGQDEEYEEDEELEFIITAAELEMAPDQEEVAPAGGGSSSSAGAIKPVLKDENKDGGKSLQQDKKDKMEKLEKKDNNEKKEKEKNREDKEKVKNDPATEPAAQPVLAKKHKPFTAEQKAWIVAEANKWGHGVPTLIEIRAIMQKGVMHGMFGAETNQEQIRHVCRFHFEQVA